MILGKKSKERETAQRELVIAYKHVFGTEHGKKVLFDLMNRYHILNPHDGGERSEGERAVVLGILQRCNVDLRTLDELLKGESE